VSTLVNKEKKYRNRGGRNGAIKAMNQLEKDGLGTLKEKSSKGTVKVNAQIHSKINLFTVCYNFRLLNSTK